MLKDDKSAFSSSKTQSLTPFQNNSFVECVLFYPFSICSLILPQKERSSHNASIPRVSNQHRFSDTEIVESYT